MLYRRVLASMLSMLMLVPCFIAFGGSNAQYANPVGTSLVKVDNSLSDSINQKLLRKDLEQADDEKTTEIDENTIVRAIIVLNSDPLADIDTNAITKDSQAYKKAKENIASEQAQMKRLIESKIFQGASIEVIYSYNTLLNGFSADIPYGKIEEINALEGVKFAYMDTSYSLPETQLSYDDVVEKSISLNSVNTTSYKGEGMTIAVLDTGLDMDHPMFTGGVDSPAFSREYIEEIIQSGDLKAIKANINETYVREKVPYQYDYGRKDADASLENSNSFHGVHVAGIACGNDGVNNNVDSAAPEAQLLVMKVFTSSAYGEGAATSDIYAALEDCVTLNVDVINMSLGYPCGFSTTYGYSNFDTVMQRAADEGIIMSVSAGNDYSGSLRAIPNGKMYGINPDNSVIGAPSTFEYSFSIASHTNTEGVSRRMSDFSSWGATPDLKLKPEISANGDEVLSCAANGKYVRASGTSMAAPYVAGGAAVVKQYLEEKYPDKTPFEIQELTTTLLMNTAQKVQGTGTSSPASPRKQGAGAMNIAKAIESKSYITVPDSSRPKFDSIDDVNETGVYTFNFDIHNISSTQATYSISADVMTEKADLYNGRNIKTTVMSEKAYLLDAAVTSNFSGNSVTVQSGETVSVEVTITLSDSAKDYIRQNYANGMYVEGFINLSSNTTSPLVIPYLCFFGDYSKPAAIDRGYYYNVLNGEPNWANLTTNKMNTKLGSSEFLLGDNPYHTGVPYIPERNAISPNSDKMCESLESIYVSLLRGVKEYSVSITGTNGDVYYEKDCSYVSRTVFATYGTMLAAGMDYRTAISKWRGRDQHEDMLPNNSQATISVDVEIDFDIHEVNNESSSWSLPITIDVEAPEIIGVVSYSVGSKKYVDITASDNQFLSNISFTNAGFSNEFDSYPIAETERNLTNTYTYDITSYPEAFGIIINDYACNRSTYSYMGQSTSELVKLTMAARTLEGSLELVLSLDCSDLELSTGEFTLNYPGDYLNFVSSQNAEGANVSMTVDSSTDNKLIVSFEGTQPIESGELGTFIFEPTAAGEGLADGSILSFKIINSEMIDVDTGDILPSVSPKFDYCFSPNYDTGDVNKDFDVNTGDAAIVLQMVAGLVEFDDLQTSLSDINCDGESNTGDAATILQMVAGLI